MLSPDLKDAVNHLQSHAQGLKAVITVADAIGSIEALEQLAAEAVNRKEAADAALARAQASLISVEASLQDVRQSAEALKKNADDAVTSAVRKSDDLVRDAEKKAAGIIDQAIADTTARVAAAIKQRSEELAVLDGEVLTLTEQKATLAAAIEAQTATLADLEDRAEKARKYLSRLTAE